MNSLIFDIETVALSDARLAKVKPEFSPPANYKKADTIEQWLEEAEKNWKEKAALSPITGRVAMIGTKHTEHKIPYLAFKDADDDALDLQEAIMLQEFWKKAVQATANGLKMVSFNGHGFDLPFMIKRCWALKVQVPKAITWGRWGFVDPWVDLMNAFSIGTPNEYISLNTVAAFFGMGKKDGDCKTLRQDLEHDPERAIAYSRQDLDLTEAIGRRMGIVTD